MPEPTPPHPLYAKPLTCSHCNGTGVQWIVDGKLLAEYRTKIGMTAVALAQRLHISASFIPMVEHGTRRAPWERWGAAWLKALGIPE